MWGKRITSHSASKCMYPADRDCSGKQGTRVTFNLAKRINLEIYMLQRIRIVLFDLNSMTSESNLHLNSIFEEAEP
jgi:hypothetical protein